MFKSELTLGIGLIAIAVSAYDGLAQSPSQISNSAPNPYTAIGDLFKLPDGRQWGATSAVDIDRDGRTIWVAERCGGNSGCLENKTVNPILHFDANGKLLGSFGAGLLISPHGIFVDRDGNVWVTDYSDNVPRAPRGTGAPADATARRGAGAPPARGATTDTATTGAAPARGRGPAGPVGAAAGATVGHQVLKFSPDGKLLLSLGKAGGAAEPDYFYQPNDVLVALNGDIFVSEGHGGRGARVLKFDKSGKFLMQFGKPGSGPGEFNVPHALAMDSRGRLFIGDRANNRIQIFDQQGQFIAEWRQFGRPSGVYIDRNDVIYVADSESGDNRNPDYKRGIRVGSAKDGSVTALIPDMTVNPGSTSSAEGIAADSAGNIYGAEVTERGVRKFVKK
jgi:streptogramin lyase